MDKILTFIGITFYHLQEVNPVGKLFLGESVTFFGIIAFCFFGIIMIECTHKYRPKVLPLSVTLLMLGVGMNIVMVFRGMIR